MPPFSSGGAGPFRCHARPWRNKTLTRNAASGWGRRVPSQVTARFAPTLGGEGLPRFRDCCGSGVETRVCKRWAVLTGRHGCRPELGMDAAPFFPGGGSGGHAQPFQDGTREDCWRRPETERARNRTPNSLRAWMRAGILASPPAGMPPGRSSAAGFAG